MGRLRARVERLESKVGPADTSPIVATMRCLGGKTFTRKTLSDYVRNTPPGFAHPVRALIAQAYLGVLFEEAEPSDGSEGGDGEYSTLVREWAVREVDKMIAEGEIPWLPQAVEEWERKPKNQAMIGINLV